MTAVLKIRNAANDDWIIFTPDGDLAAHLADLGNPHSVTAVQAGAMTAAQHTAIGDGSPHHGHANKAQLDIVTDGDHDVRVDNPHGVTAVQAGAAPTAHTHTHVSTTGQTASDHHTRYADAEAQAVADTQIAAHAARSTRQHVVSTLWGTISAALTWSAAQIYQAAVTFQNGIATDTISEFTADTGVTVDTVLVRDGLVDGVDISRAREGACRGHTVTTLWGTISAALTWSAAQIYQAAATFQEAVSITASKTTSLLMVNQSSTGDIARFKDGGNATVRIPDGGGIVLVPQVGGVNSNDGLLYYDNAATGFKRLKLRHEGHNYPVPVDPRNGFRNVPIHTTYP